MLAVCTTGLASWQGLHSTRARGPISSLCDGIYATFSSTYTYEFKAQLCHEMLKINTPNIRLIPDIAVNHCQTVLLTASEWCPCLAAFPARLVTAASRLDHRCPMPLRFHHARWSSLGVWPRPPLAPFDRHVEDKFCIGFNECAVVFFVLPRVSWGIKSFCFFSISDVRVQEHTALR